MQDRNSKELFANSHQQDNNNVSQQSIKSFESSSSSLSFPDSLKSLFGSFKFPLTLNPSMSNTHSVPLPSNLSIQTHIDSNYNNKHGLLFYFLNSFSNPDRNLSMSSMNDIWMREHKWRLHNLHLIDAYSLLHSCMDETNSISNQQRCKLLLLLTSNLHENQRNSQIALYLAYLVRLFHHQTSLKYDQINQNNNSIYNHNNNSSLSSSQQLSDNSNANQLLFHSIQFLSDMVLTLRNLNISLYLPIKQYQQQYLIQDQIESHLLLLTHPLITLTQLFSYSYHTILMCLSLFMISAYPLEVIHQLIDSNISEYYFIDLIQNLIAVLIFPHSLPCERFALIKAKEIYEIMIEYQDKK